MLTNEQYSILAKRLVEEHRKYSDKFGWQFPDNWAEIAVRKVVAQLADFGVTQKVLTDDELYRQAMEDVTPDALERIDKAIKAIDAPAAGLTVEEHEQLVKEWCIEWCERVAPDDNDWSDLRARLTAAIEAKTSPLQRTQ